MDVSAVVAVVAIVLLASAAQGLTGFGFALVAVPVLVLVVDVKDAVVIASLLGTVNVALLALRVWREAPWANVARLLAGSFIGMPAGLAVLLLAPQDALRIVVGLSAIVMAGALARGVRYPFRGPAGEVVVGTASGILRTSTSMSGPPVVLYLQGTDRRPREFRAALTMFFLLGSITSIAAFLGAGVVTEKAWVLAAAALPAVLVGNVGGDLLLRFVDQALFRRLVVLLLVATALSAVGSSIQRLVG